MPELAICHFDSMFDTVSVAPDSSGQLRTIVLRKRQNCEFYVAAGRLSTWTRAERCDVFYAAVSQACYRGDYRKVLALKNYKIWCN